MEGKVVSSVKHPTMTIWFGMPFKGTTGILCVLDVTRCIERVLSNADVFLVVPRCRHDASIFAQFTIPISCGYLAHGNCNAISTFSAAIR
jgi:hypothetical protein